MTNRTLNNRRIAKNTMFLYFRTFLIMLVTLYTSRVVLQALGETDFGIYNIVGGIVILFSFLNQAMSTATQRFLNYALGKNDIAETHRIFSMSMTVHIAIAVLVLLLSETIGIWVINTQLNIPNNRIVAAHWAYQFSVFGCCLQIIRIPYNATIIAYENMSFYAYISIIEVILKLLICYFLIISSIDKLIFYGLLMFLVILIINIVNWVYCKYKFTTTKYKYFGDKLLFKELISFSGWSLFGSIANIGSHQGLNILFNIFVGVIANAAMGITSQVTAAVTSFVSGFQTAFIPQLVKSFAAGEITYFNSLLFRASRISFYLVWIIGFPIIMCCGTLMRMWLGYIPNYTIEFVNLFVIICLIDACSSPLWNAIQATGMIKRYQIAISFIKIIIIPIAYFMLRYGLSPVLVIIMQVILNFVAHLYRIVYLRRQIKLSVTSYIRQVMVPILSVIILSLPVPLIFINKINDIILLILAMIISIINVIIFGLTASERNAIFKQIKSYSKLFSI